jgi:hypothetical protein
MFVLKWSILPKQARDKHRESTQKEMRFPLCNLWAGLEDLYPNGDSNCGVLETGEGKTTQQNYYAFAINRSK